MLKAKYWQMRQNNSKIRELIEIIEQTMDFIDIFKKENIKEKPNKVNKSFN